jgi:hypothetical protein
MQLIKLFRKLKYSPMQNLNIFWAMEGFHFQFVNLSWIRNLKEYFFTGPGPPVRGPTVFNHVRQSSDPRAARHRHGHRAHGGERAGAVHRLSSPLHMPGQSLSGRTCALEGFLPYPFLLSRDSALLCSHARATALLTISSHRRAASVLSVRALRSASTPWTFCTELLPGARATEAGQQSYPRRRLPLRELTAEWHAPSFSGCALTSWRFPAASWPT